MRKETAKTNYLAMNNFEKVRPKKDDSEKEQLKQDQSHNKNKLEKGKSEEEETDKRQLRK